MQLKEEITQKENVEVPKIIKARLELKDDIKTKVYFMMQGIKLFDDKK